MSTQTINMLDGGSLTMTYLGKNQWSVTVTDVTGLVTNPLTITWSDQTDKSPPGT
jgi:hypothetical protein